MSRMRRIGVLGFIGGTALGCLFGALTTLMPRSTSQAREDILGTNARTGRPQLHLKGQREIPDVK
jgi:hypothetical protein